MHPYVAFVLWYLVRGPSAIPPQSLRVGFDKTRRDYGGGVERGRRVYSLKMV